MLNQPANKKVVLVLFHNDLRVHDNATLSKAAQLASGVNDKGNHNNQDTGNHAIHNSDGRLILLYAPSLADELVQSNRAEAYNFAEMGDARQRFLCESLSDLSQSLERLGNTLLYLQPYDNSNSKPNDDFKRSSTFTLLCQLIEQQHVTDICVSATADYAQNKVYAILQNKYPQLCWHVQATATLFEQMPTDDLPKSFTQFRKKVESDNNLLAADSDITIANLPELLPPLPKSLENNREYFSEIKDFAGQAQLDNFIGGESNALAHLHRYFDSSAPSTYKTTRNTLDDWTHSTKFSAWLANGSLSVKTLLNRLRHYEREVVANDSTYWIWFELLWREYFYWYAVNHQQKLFLFQGINDQKPTTTFNNKRLTQWQNGTTPYPIVNACMNQLRRTGYMSNRGRQIVASCFIHELGLDWRYGATYFEQHLIDYDVASNWGNWQYLAGVGADPRGCRQFNLKKQTQQHDPKNEFIDKWA